MKSISLCLSLLLGCAPVTMIEGSTSGEWPESTGAPESTSTTGVPPGGGSGKVSETDPNTSAPEFCSDGLREPWEECDDGKLEGGYGGCEAGCKRGPHCGDGVIDVGHEVCDGGEGCPLDCGLKGCEEISP